MGGCRCSYKTCINTTKTTDNIHFFHYPVKQKERCKAWIQNANKPQFFDLDEYQLRNKVVCEAHFLDNCFLNSQKKRLLPNSIPTLDGDSCFETPSSTIAPVFQKPIKTEERYKQFSTKMDDIQILPASEDGTLFVLDTFPSYKVSKEVKSYILNDDALLPLDRNNSIHTVKTELVDPDNEGDSRNEFILSDDGAMNVFQTKASNFEHNMNVNYSKEMMKKRSLESSSNVTDSQNSVLAKNISTKALENMINKTVESKFINKLDQQGKDLNYIKKILKVPKSGPKLNKINVLRFLKLRLPPSLYTLVNLSINDDYELSDEDENFFKSLHDSSSKSYDFLMNECNWRMPIIEIHEGDLDIMETM